MLERAGHICYARGRIHVLDHRGPESGSCRCYRIVNDEYERMLKPSSADRAGSGSRRS